MIDQSIEEQEWKQQRVGHFTASNIYKIFVSGRGKNPDLFGQGAMTYIRERVAERLTMESREQSDFKQTEWGKLYEPEACKKFEKLIGEKGIYYGVQNPKFFSCGESAGGSPDFETIDASEGADFKCPYSTAVHIENFLINSVEEFKDKKYDYYSQGQMNMHIRGWKKFHFVSYDPRMIDPAFKMKVITMYPDSEWLKDFEFRLKSAIQECEAIIKSMNGPTLFIASHDQEVNTMIVQPA